MQHLPEPDSAGERLSVVRLGRVLVLLATQGILSTLDWPEIGLTASDDMRMGAMGQRG